MTLNSGTISTTEMINILHTIPIYMSQRAEIHKIIVSQFRKCKVGCIIALVP